ncbi:MAG TPA: lmo0937 family membrane protein [Ktedonobacteraceae bacterium]|nr:lmo0937 family membrane protein [Ktedonobacteraceae bacterium]
MFGILWGVVVVLVILWLLGFLFHIAGGLIHLLLVLAVIVLIYNLIMRSRSRGTV